MANKYTPAVARAQKKYREGLRQFKFALSKQTDAALIRLLENIPNLKAWITNQLKKESAMKIKVVKMPEVRRLIVGKYVDTLDLDYTQSLENLQKDIELALPSLMANLSVFDNVADIGDVLVYRGGSHIDIVLDGKRSLDWLRIEDHYEPVED